MRRPGSPEHLEADYLIQARSYMKDFNALSEVDRQSLIERIKSSEGVIRLYMHPYYLDPDAPTYPKVVEQKSKLENLIRGFERLLSFSSDRIQPLFIFEDEKKLEDTQQRIASLLLQSKQDVYIIPTTSDGIPQTSNEPYSTESHSIEQDVIFENSQWNDCIVRLRDLGVSRVIAGGIWFQIRDGDTYIFEPSNTKYNAQRLTKGAQQVSYTLAGCAGRAINQLAKEFDVELSGLTFDGSRWEVLRKEYPMKGNAV